MVGRLVVMLLRAVGPGVQSGVRSGARLKIDEVDSVVGIVLVLFLERLDSLRHPLLIEEPILLDDRTDGGRAPKRLAVLDLSGMFGERCALGPVAEAGAYVWYVCLSLEPHDVGGVDCEAWDRELRTLDVTVRVVSGTSLSLTEPLLLLSKPRSCATSL